MMKISTLFKVPNISLGLLKLIFVFKNLFENWGINVEQLEIILKTKIIVNQRKPNNPFIGQQARAKSTTKNMDLIQIFLFLVMGFVYLAVIASHKTPVFGYTIFFGGLMSVVVMSSIMEFSTILIDEKDTYIVFPRPINDVTVICSRYLLMFIYVLKISLIFSTPVWIYTLINIGILPAILLVFQIIWLSGLLVLLVCIVYLMLFQLQNPYKIKQWIAKFQIVVTVFFTLQFYCSSYLMKFRSDNFKLSDSPWISSLPSTWISSWQNILVFHQTDKLTISVALLGIFIPLILGWVFIKVLSKNFNQKIAAMSFSETENIESPKEVIVTRNSSLVLQLSKLFNKSTVEQSAFRTVWALTNRFNEFKMRFYPSFGILFAYGFIMILNLKGTWEQKLDTLRDSQTIPIMVIYYSGLILNGALGQLGVSGKYKASWIYYVAPIAKPGEILSGSFKAILIKYFSPFYLLLSAAEIYLFGLPIINDLILGYILVCIVSIIINVLIYNSFPFSTPVDYYKGKWYLGFILLFAQFLVGGFHFLIFRWETAVWVAIPIAIVTLCFMFKYYGKQSWLDIQTDKSD